MAVTSTAPQSSATSSKASSPSSASANTPIKCVGLTKVFKDFWLRNRVTAVKDINLEVKRGEVFGLLGPNGSGKSTTIKMILGLLNPTEGKIAVLGKPPSDVAVKKQIGYLPEESYLYRFLTPTETLDYYAKLFGQDKAQRQKRAETLLEMVGLTHAAHRPVGEFSKGMQRKVGLAQALINDPDLLILDEPTSGMDPIATSEVKNVIQQLKARGKTILLCSHLLADVQDVCDRVVVMYGGKVREEGHLANLLQVQDKTVIETDQLDDVIVTEIEQVLQKHGHSILKSEHPRKNLDQLFLEIVEKARQEGASTAGATQGGQIAAFLSSSESTTDDASQGQDSPTTAESQAVLSALTQPQPQSSDEQLKPSQSATSSAAVSAESLLTESQAANSDAAEADAAKSQAVKPAADPALEQSADTSLLSSLSGQTVESSEQVTDAQTADNTAASESPISEPADEQADQSVLGDLLGENKDKDQS